MTKEKRNDTIVAIGVIVYLVISLFTSAWISDKLFSTGDYSNLYEKAKNITSSEQLIQKADSVKGDSEVIIATFKERSKELIVSYEVNTGEILSTTKSYGGIKEFLACILALIIFVIIIAISLYIIIKIDDIKIDRQYSQYKS